MMAALDPSIMNRLDALNYYTATKKYDLAFPRLTEDLDAEPQDVFPEADGFSPGALKDSGWTALGQVARASEAEASNLEAYVAEERTLRDHLTEQLLLAFADPSRRLSLGFTCNSGTGSPVGDLRIMRLTTAVLRAGEPHR